MQLNRSLTSIPIAILAFTMFFVSASASAQAQGQLTYEPDDWIATLTGTPVDSLESLTLAGPGFISLTACLELDPADGQLEGFLFWTRFVFPPTVSLFDGDTLVETVPFATGGPTFIGGPSGRVFAWTNTEGINVTKIKFDVENLGDDIDISILETSYFPNVVEPPITTVPELLIPILIDDIEELIDSNDNVKREGKKIQKLLNNALKDLNKRRFVDGVAKLFDAMDQVSNLIDDGSISTEQGQPIVYALEQQILFLTL